MAKEKAVTSGYPTTTNHRGEIIPESERNINSEQAGYLIDELHSMAAFLDVRLIESSSIPVQEVL